MEKEDKLFYYRKLITEGEKEYGRSAPGVQRIGPEIFVKFGSRIRREEADIMTYVAKHSSIPIPKVMDVIEDKKNTYIVMSALPGNKLGGSLNTMTPEEILLLKEDLMRCFAELRSLDCPFFCFSPLSSKNVLKINYICGFGRSKCFDYRVGTEPFGPFQTESTFNTYLKKIVPSCKLASISDKIEEAHSIPHRIVLTHGDIKPGNILVKDGRLSGIVDWENAGWYPEYWELTKSLYNISLYKPWIKLMTDIFPGYETELEAERKLWAVGSPW